MPELEISNLEGQTRCYWLSCLDLRAARALGEPHGGFEKAELLLLARVTHSPRLRKACRSAVYAGATLASVTADG